MPASTNSDMEKPRAEEVEDVGPVITGSSQQDPDVAPDLQLRAIIVTIAAGLFWIQQLFTITVLAAFSRNIVGVLGDSAKTAWVLNSFNVVTIVGSPIIAHYSDMNGRKWVIVGAMIFGVVGGAVGGRAKSTNVVLVGAALVGIPGSLIGAVTAIPSEVLPHRYRSAGQALVFSLSGLAAFPALLGISKAIQVDAVDGWRWAFYCMIIGYGLQIPLWGLAYKPPKRVNELTKDRPSLDYIGYGLLVGATIPFLMALTWGGVAFPWGSAHVIAPLVVGIVVYILFGVWEWKGRSDGLLHHALFKNKNFPLSVLAIFIEGLVYLSFSALYPAQTATVYEHDIFKAGQRALPFYGALIIALPLGGWYVSKTRDTITPIIFGYTLFTGALIGFALSTPSTPNLFIGMDVLAGFGFAFPLTFLTVVAQFAVPPALIGTGTAIVLTMRALGGAIGIAVTETVMSTKLAAALPAYVAKATLPLGLPQQLLGPVIGAAASGNPQAIAAVSQLPGVTPQILGAAFGAAASAFSHSYKYAWITVIPFSVIGTLSIVLLKVKKDQLDFIIDAPLQAVHHHHRHEESAGH